MGNMEDEYNRLKGGTTPARPVLLGGNGAPQPPTAPATQPSSALTRPPIPVPDPRANLPQPGAGVADAMQQRGTAPATPAAPSNLRASLPQPAAGLADTIHDRAMASAQFDTPHAAQPAPDLRTALNQRNPVGELANAQYDRAAAGARAPAPAAAPVSAPDPRAAFGTQPGQALSEASAARSGLPAPAAPPTPAASAVSDLRASLPQPAAGLSDAMYDRAMAGKYNPSPAPEPGLSPTRNSMRAAAEAAANPNSARAAAMAPPGADTAGMANKLRGSVGLGEMGAAPAGAAPPPGAPGAIRSAAQTAFGNGEQWSQFGQKARAGINAVANNPVVKQVVKRAPLIGAVAGGAEAVHGLANNDMGQAGLGAADAAASLALASPAAPAAAVYLTGRGAWEGGKMLGNALPETARDSIGSGINSVVRGAGKLFGQDWGVDDSALQAQRGSIAAAATAASKPPAAKPTAKPAGPVMTEDQADQYSLQQQARQSAKPAAPAAAPTGPVPGDQRQQAMLDRYYALHKESRESPISGIDYGGSYNGTHISYKDGSEAVIPHGQPLPSEAQQYLDRSYEVSNLMNGSWQAPAPAPGTAATPAAAAPANPNLSENQRRIQSNAQEMGYDPARAMMISSIETGGKFNHDAQNPNSSAFGLFQMTKENRAAYPMTAAQWKDPAVQARAGIDFMMKTDAGLTSSLGRAPTPAESYMGHLLGVKGATALLGADPNAPIEKVVAGFSPKNAKAIVNNNGMSGMTAGQAIGKWTGLAASHMPGGGGAGGSASPIVQQAQVAAGGIPGGVPPELREQPIWEMRGMHSTIQMPDGSVVSPSIYNAAMASGDFYGKNSPYTKYRDAQVQGEIYGVNPLQAKLDEQALQNQGSAAVAATTGQYGVQGHTIAGKAHVDAAKLAAESGKQSFINTGGGVDPTTFAPLPQRVFDTQTKTFVDPPAKPKPSQAAATAQAQAAIKAGGTKEAANAILANYGYPPIN
jgi:hypothetical protein